MADWPLGIKTDDGPTGLGGRRTTIDRRSTGHDPSRISRHASSSLLSLGLFLTGVGGAFAPWIWRESVALQLTGPGLAEFVKFLPEIRINQVHIERLWFLLPLFVAMIALPLIAENKILMLASWLRWGLRLVVIPFALAALSPVWTPEILIASEFRLQTGLAVVAIGLAIAAPMLKGLPLKAVALFLVGGGIAAIILPIWHFRLIQPPLAAVYNGPVSLGWGWWLTVVGIVMSIIGGVWAAFFSTMKSNKNRQQARSKLIFRPHPLVRSPHVQTVASSLHSPKNTALQRAARSMTLDAGDGVRLQGFYSPRPEKRSKGLVLLLHGWLGHANASYVVTIGDYLYRQGYAIFRLNFRDHGDTHNLNPGLYRGDLLDEVFGATRLVAELESQRPFHVIGASMGGNVAMQIAWRCAQRPVPNLGHIIAFNPDINPYHTVLALDTGPAIYLAYFRRKWRASYQKKQAAFPALYDFSELSKARTCMAMTEAFVRYTPHASAANYFKSYTVTPAMMATLRNPLTVITAADDPIVSVSDFFALVDLTDDLMVHIQPYGGHVGFIDIFPFRVWACQAALTILENFV